MSWSNATTISIRVGGAFADTTLYRDWSNCDVFLECATLARLTDGLLSVEKVRESTAWYFGECADKGRAATLEQVWEGNEAPALVERARRTGHHTPDVYDEQLIDSCRWSSLTCGDTDIIIDVDDRLAVDETHDEKKKPASLETLDAKTRQAILDSMSERKPTPVFDRHRLETIDDAYDRELGTQLQERLFPFDSMFEEASWLLAALGPEYGYAYGRTDDAKRPNVSGVPTFESRQLRDGDLDRVFDALELDVKTRNCLKRVGITTLRQLASARVEDLMSIRNFSRLCILDTERFLRSYGLRQLEIGGLTAQLSRRSPRLSPIEITQKKDSDRTWS